MCRGAKEFLCLCLQRDQNVRAFAIDLAASDFLRNGPKLAHLVGGEERLWSCKDCARDTRDTNENQDVFTIDIIGNTSFAPRCPVTTRPSIAISFNVWKGGDLGTAKSAVFADHQVRFISLNRFIIDALSARHTPFFGFVGVEYLWL